MFALVLALAADITPIITSSSDDKLSEIKKVYGSRVLTINYKKTSDIAAEVHRLTNGKGVDVVVNNTGVGSIPTDIASLRARGGTVSIVGFLAGFDAEWKPVELMAVMGKAAQIK
jgi:NADPH:quinone reductase-like Zn-dependent oxidoreductase